MHQSLSERAASDYRSAVVVLYSSGKDFRSRCRRFVDEHYERYALIAATAVAAELLSWRFPSFGIYNELVLGQELVYHLHSRFEISARVVAQVYHEVCESLLRQFRQSHEQFGVSVLTEVLYLDISRILIEHIHRRNALLRNVGTRYGEVFHGFRSIPHHSDFHLSALLALQSAHRLFVGHHLSHKRLSVHANYLVAGQYSSLLCRTVLHHVLHVDGVLSDNKFHADSRERALEVVLRSLHVFGADINRVRVEVRKYLRYRHINERVDVHVVNILIVDDMQQVVQSVASRVYDIQSVAREMVGIESADHHTHYHADCHKNRRQSVGSILSHIRLD